MLINYVKFEKICSLSYFHDSTSQSKDRSCSRTQNKDYFNHVAEHECVNYEISFSSIVFSWDRKKKFYLL